MNKVKLNNKQSYKKINSKTTRRIFDESKGKTDNEKQLSVLF